MGEHRATGHLNSAMRRYPQTPKLVEQVLASRGAGLPDWPKWCFVPMGGWYAMASAAHGGGVLAPDQAPEVARLAALGTWRYSQGVYRIDETLLNALIESPLSGNLPSDVFMRLPEWCVYIETPGLPWPDAALYGFWAHMEWDVNESRPELRLLLDTADGLLGWPLHVGAWSVEEAVARSVAEELRQAKRAGVQSPLPENAVGAITEHARPLLSLLLYLCSDEPEVDDARMPGVSPVYPTPRRTKKGWRLFAPNKTRVWSVGDRIGAQLRSAGDSAGQEAGETAGRSVKAHLRRGHWHGFWSGPRDGERTFSYRWLSPLIVGSKTS